MLHQSASESPDGAANALPHTRADTALTGDSTLPHMQGVDDLGSGGGGQHSGAAAGTAGRATTAVVGDSPPPRRPPSHDASERGGCHARARKGSSSDSREELAWTTGCAQAGKDAWATTLPTPTADVAVGKGKGCDSDGAGMATSKGSPSLRGAARDRTVIRSAFRDPTVAGAAHGSGGGDPLLPRHVRDVASPVPQPPGEAVGGVGSPGMAIAREPSPARDDVYVFVDNGDGTGVLAGAVAHLDGSCVLLGQTILCGRADGGPHPLCGTPPAGLSPPPPTHTGVAQAGVPAGGPAWAGSLHRSGLDPQPSRIARLMLGPAEGSTRRLAAPSRCTEDRVGESSFYTAAGTTLADSRRTPGVWLERSTRCRSPSIAGAAGSRMRDSLAYSAAVDLWVSHGGGTGAGEGKNNCDDAFACSSVRVVVMPTEVTTPHALAAQGWIPIRPQVGLTPPDFRRQPTDRAVDVAEDGSYSPVPVDPALVGTPHLDTADGAEGPREAAVSRESAAYDNDGGRRRSCDRDPVVCRTTRVARPREEGAAPDRWEATVLFSKDTLASISRRLNLSLSAPLPTTTGSPSPEPTRGCGVCDGGGETEAVHEAATTMGVGPVRVGALAGAGEGAEPAPAPVPGTPHSDDDESTCVREGSPSRTTRLTAPSTDAGPDLDASDLLTSMSFQRPSTVGTGSMMGPGGLAAVGGGLTDASSASMSIHPYHLQSVGAAGGVGPARHTTARAVGGLGRHQPPTQQQQRRAVALRAPAAGGTATNAVAAHYRRQQQQQQQYRVQATSQGSRRDSGASMGLYSMNVSSFMASTSTASTNIAKTHDSTATSTGTGNANGSLSIRQGSFQTTLCRRAAATAASPTAGMPIGRGMLGPARAGGAAAPPSRVKPTTGPPLSASSPPDGAATMVGGNGDGASSPGAAGEVGERPRTDAGGAPTLSWTQPDVSEASTSSASTWGIDTDHHPQHPHGPERQVLTALEHELRTPARRRVTDQTPDTSVFLPWTPLTLASEASVNPAEGGVGTALPPAAAGVGRGGSRSPRRRSGDDTPHPPPVPERDGTGEPVRRTGRLMSGQALEALAKMRRMAGGQGGAKGAMTQLGFDLLDTTTTTTTTATAQTAGRQSGVDLVASYLLQQAARGMDRSGAPPRPPIEGAVDLDLVLSLAATVNAGARATHRLTPSPTPGRPARAELAAAGEKENSDPAGWTRGSGGGLTEPKRPLPTAAPTPEPREPSLSRRAPSAGNTTTATAQ